MPPQPRHGESNQESASRQAPVVRTVPSSASSSSATPSSSTTRPRTTSWSPPPAILPRITGSLAYLDLHRSPPPTIVPRIPESLAFPIPTTTRDIGTSVDLESSPSTTDSATQTEPEYLMPPAPPRGTQESSYSPVSNISIPPGSQDQPSSSAMGANNSREVPETIINLINAARDAAIAAIDRREQEAIAEIKRLERESIAAIKRQEQEYIAAITKAASDLQKQKESTATSPTITGHDESLSDVPLQNIKEEDKTKNVTTTTPAADDANTTDPFSPAADKPICFCATLPVGKMVLCDGSACQYRFFHVTCLGMSQNVLKRHRQRETDWLCAECKGEMPRGQLRKDWMEGEWQRLGDELRKERGEDGTGDAKMEEGGV